MPPRSREDLSRQEAALREARAQLADRLDTLAVEAKAAAKAARTKKGRPDLPAVYGAKLDVEAAEEACDLAALDLETAAGGDA